MLTLLRKIIKETISEVFQSTHFKERVFDRLMNPVLTKPPLNYSEIYSLINKLREIKFPMQYSFAIKLFSSPFKHISRDWDYIEGEPGKINSEGEDIWVIIKDDKIVTAMLRNKSQPISKKMAESDFIINDFSELAGGIEKYIMNHPLPRRPLGRRNNF